jgi:hypothetical protein
VLSLSDENELETAAKEMFGTSKDCRNAFFILSDGTFLRRMDMKNSIFFEHSSLAHIYGEEENEEIVTQFMRETGAIRLSPLANSTNIELIKSKGVTFDQKEALKKCVCDGLRPHRIIYDVLDDDTGEYNISGQFAESEFRDEPCSKIVNQFMRLIESL